MCNKSLLALSLLLHIGLLVSCADHSYCIIGACLASTVHHTASYITSAHFLANLQCSDVSCGIEGENRFIHTVYGLWDHSTELPMDLEGTSRLSWP